MVAALLVFVLLLSVLVPLALYLLISDETANPTLVDRETAEREAKAQGGLGTRGRDRNVDGRDGPSADASGRASDDTETDSWGYSRLEDDEDRPDRRRT
ncbi:hypothetical protein [Natronorubrum sulfidifaciens]|uniref:Uncharacterized protein n=1 Tax=Natronorubrum sulfidifaciens JCM 14089 TaxID=1230460 RepID=L9WBY6_9EURY|nr:hypothetical protein [Natronorubrum sulfidifaciens]ELY46791.1 hypothetical protein C495_06773 [Natronorubrum sulfidifaciens JCM 14089]